MHKHSEQYSVEYASRTKFFAIVGKLNGGKSSLCNWISQRLNPETVDRDAIICKTGRKPTTSRPHQIYMGDHFYKHHDKIGKNVENRDYIYDKIIFCVNKSDCANDDNEVQEVKQEIVKQLENYHCFNHKPKEHLEKKVYCISCKNSYCLDYDGEAFLDYLVMNDTYGCYTDILPLFKPQMTNTISKIDQQLEKLAEAEQFLQNKGEKRLGDGLRQRKDYRQMKNKYLERVKQEIEHKTRIAALQMHLEQNDSIKGVLNLYDLFGKDSIKQKLLRILSYRPSKLALSVVEDIDTIDIIPRTGKKPPRLNVSFDDLIDYLQSVLRNEYGNNE